VARYKRLKGYDVMFLTGTDEHGQKIERKAKEKGVTPKQYVDEIVAGIKELWKLLKITNDRFIRTTDPHHEKTVQKIFKKLYDQGDIYKSEYEGCIALLVSLSGRRHSWLTENVPTAEGKWNLQKRRAISSGFPNIRTG